jgi:eukaryotic-like serine/threonine-protein kinase
LIGDILGDRFLIEAEVSRGGMGVVYRGWDLEHERPIAVKVLVELAPIDRQRFLREATLLAQIESPNLVRYVAHADTDNGEPYLVMDWLEGETVARRLDTIGFDGAGAVAMVHATANAVAHLHDRGLVHRDLKPENIIITASGEVVLIDLGLARAVRNAEQRVTETGVALGTPGYMSPEQIRGEKVDARSDVFALGCILYEALTGYTAFAGHNHLAVRTKVMLWTPAPVARLCPEAPPQLAALIDAMLAKARDDRPANGREVARALAAIRVPEGGPKRTWRMPEAPTVEHAAPARRAVEDWHAIVLVHAADPDADTRQLEDRTSELAAMAVELRTAIAGSAARLEILEDACLVVSSYGADLAALAGAMAAAALGLRALLPRARMVVSCGIGSIGELVDRASVLLERASRQPRRAAGDGMIALDAESAVILAEAYVIDRYWLVGRRS